MAVASLLAGLVFYFSVMHEVHLQIKRKRENLVLELPLCSLATARLEYHRYPIPVNNFFEVFLFFYFMPLLGSALQEYHKFFSLVNTLFFHFLRSLYHSFHTNLNIVFSAFTYPNIFAYITSGR